MRVYAIVSRCQTTILAHEKGYYTDQSYFLEGDLILGGIIKISYPAWKTSLNFRNTNEIESCRKVDPFSYLRHLLTFFIAIEEINQNAEILPNITLGLHIIDSCSDAWFSLCGILSILSGKKELVPGYTCYPKSHVVGFIGRLPSLASHAVARLTGIYRYPQLNQYLKEVHFKDPDGREIFFDDKRHVATYYDIMQVFQFPNLTTAWIHVGRFKPSAPKDKQLFVNLTAIRWKTPFNQA
ncbi:extracellular calcium-sensing receptor-like [Microcaecilia unicolor]|uniref:Extracellular calcium-sensing receptor-like n=1 Tax=Microcaecilia unicolor TaxID=1415580 RepID=A0A6P7WZ42_9AMPH|nr:extracellular calcium-sensing receptor-like [Microcaecilia unicolor]